MTLIKMLEKCNAKHYINKCFRHDAGRYRKYSCHTRPENERQWIAVLSIKSHVLEKGLSMPDMRLGFGQPKVRDLMKLCLQYSQHYGTSHPVWIHAVENVKEYVKVHAEQHYTFDETMQKELDAFVKSFETIEPSVQPLSDQQEYFRHTNDSFEGFSAHRHSVRCFSDKPVSMEVLQSAVALAMNAPSACNRQSQRVHVVCDKPTIQKVLSLQNGNNGFGQMADKLIILTFDLSCYGDGRSRNLGYIDSGIFAMNLLYSLYYYQIGACPLNWCDSPKDDKAIRSAIPIPPEETITLLIICGNVPEQPFRLARSKRLPVDRCLIIHK